MPVIQAILWDVGGTLLIDGVSPAQSIRYRMDRAGIEHHQLTDRIITQSCNSFLLNERNWLTLADEYRAQQDLAKVLLTQLGKPYDGDNVEYVAQFLKNYYDVLKPVPGIFELLEKLQSTGIRQAVVSNWPPSLPLVLDHFDLTRFFSPIVFSAEDGIHKPDQRIFDRTLSIINLQPRQVLFIGDNPEWDIIPTRAMGMNAIQFDPRRRHFGYEATTVAELESLIFRHLR